MTAGYDSTGTAAVATLALNGADAALTLTWVKMGWAEEANPFLEPLLDRPVVFVVVKMALATLGVGALWLRRADPRARRGLTLMVGVYGVLVGYHLWHALARAVAAVGSFSSP